MNGSEIMLDAVNGIAPDLVDEAAEYRFKRNGTNALAWAAAACLMLGVGAAMAAALLNGAETPGNETAQGIETAKKTEQILPQPTEEQKVMYNSADEFICGSVLNKGDLIISEALRKAMTEETDTNCLFAVKILASACEKSEAYIENVRDRLFSDPVYMQFMREFEQWEPTYELTETERRLEEKGVSRVDIAMDRFKEIWKSEKSEELAAKLEELEARMDDWRANLTGLREYLEVCRAEELARLIGLGYPIETNEFGQWCSKLTADQINAFPADPGWGYEILWASDREGFV